VRAAIDRPEAKWLPSRHRYALARLVAFMALHALRATVRPNRRVVLPIDRDQSTLENYAIALWIFITSTLYLIALVRPALWMFMPLVAAALLEVPLYATGLFIAPILRAIAKRPGENNHRFVSIANFLTLAAISAWFAWTLTWARFVAYFFFAVMALNAAAFVIMLMLRGSVARVEAEYGGTPFAP
jgi:hypothetical protein